MRRLATPALLASLALTAGCVVYDDPGYVIPDLSPVEGPVVAPADGWDAPSFEAPDDRPGEQPLGKAKVALLASSGDGSSAAGGEISFGPNGMAFAAWVVSDNGNGDIWLACSTDGGETWDDPVPVETGAIPSVTGAERRPYVAVDAERVAVIWTSNPDPATWVAIAERGEGPLVFGEPAFVGTADDHDMEDFANGVFLSTGELAVVTHSTDFDRDPIDALYLSRESDGWAPVEITEAVPGEPCECCALDLRATDDGGLQVVYRNNIDNVRDQFLLTITSDDQVSWSQVSTTAWEIWGCPMQGPRMAALPNGDLAVVWGDPTAGENQIWMARSTDGGVSWIDEHRVAPMDSEFQRWPRIAADADGVLTVGYHTGTTVWATSSSDGGATFSEPVPVEVPEGQLEIAELAVGPTGAAMVGTTGEQPDASVWFTPVQ